MTEANRILLGVNVDHVATLRQARGTRYPDPVKAALDAEEAGADGITVHPREDRRHIQTRDVRLLAEVLNTRMNLEMAVTEEMLALAEEIRPAHVCLVPEKREELTTEGGLDVAADAARLAVLLVAVRGEVLVHRHLEHARLDDVIEGAHPDHVRLRQRRRIVAQRHPFQCAEGITRRECARRSRNQRVHSNPDTLVTPTIACRRARLRHGQ